MLAQLEELKRIRDKEKEKAAAVAAGQDVPSTEGVAPRRVACA